MIDDNDSQEALVGLFDTQEALFESFPRGASYEAAALQTASGRRLDWFAGPFLSYHTQKGDETTKLVATDLRLGISGFHPFSFLLAERSNILMPEQSRLLLEEHSDDLSEKQGNNGWIPTITTCYSLVETALCRTQNYAAPPIRKPVFPGLAVSLFGIV